MVTKIYYKNTFFKITYSYKPRDIEIIENQITSSIDYDNFDNLNCNYDIHCNFISYFNCKSKSLNNFYHFVKKNIYKESLNSNDNEETLMNYIDSFENFKGTVDFVIAPRIESLMSIIKIEDNLFRIDYKDDYDGRTTIKYNFLTSNFNCHNSKRININNTGYQSLESLEEYDHIPLTHCSESKFIMKINIEFCPTYCKRKECDFKNKICYSEDTIWNTIKYIKKEKFSLENHFNSTIITPNDYNYKVYLMDFNTFSFPHNTFITDFCMQILYQKYSPINYFTIFHCINNTEKSLIMKYEENVDREIMNYKKYCRNYSLENIYVYTMDKKVKIDYLPEKIKDMKNNKLSSCCYCNDILNNTIKFEKIRGRLEFENETKYENYTAYNICEPIYFKRWGIYYIQEFIYELLYGSLKFPYENPPIGNLIFEIYPLYCDKVNHENRTCWTNYSLNGIKDQIEKANKDLHEHINERIIGNKFIVDIYNITEDNIDDYFPLHQCLKIYQKIDENKIKGLIFIKYKEENQIYYEMYNSSWNNHTKLNIEFCVFHNTSNFNYKIRESDILEINLNDLISPKLTERNIYDYFKLFLSDKGIFQEEKFLTKEINDIGVVNTIYETKSRKLFYKPNGRYYSISFNYELLHISGIKNDDIKTITIDVFPNYCEPIYFYVNEKKCFTNYNLDYIKNYIVNDVFNYQSHLNEVIINPLYNLTFDLINNYVNETCSNILRKFYGITNDIQFFVININQNINPMIIELYNILNTPFEKINLELCDKGYIYNIEEIINYKSIIKVKKLINDILPNKDSIETFFQLVNYSEDQYLNKNVRRLKTFNINNLDINYIPDEFKYYNETYYFGIEKDGVFLNIKGKIKYIVYPKYCKEYHYDKKCPSNKTLNEIIDYINNKDIQNIKDHSNEIIYNEDYNIQIEEINYKINLNSKKLDFEKCEKEIRNHYPLKENENIYLETIDNKISNEFSFYIFNSTGYEFDSSYCSSIGLKNNLNPKILDLNLYENLNNLGYDVFNLSDSFYTNLCINFSINGNDVTLYDRRKRIYPQNSLCYKNCDFGYFDKKEKIYYCECNISQNNQIFYLKNLNGDYNDYDKKKYFINYKFVKCINLVLDINILKINFGFYILTLIVLFQIINFFYYLCSVEESFHTIIQFLNIDVSKNIALEKNKKKNVIIKTKDSKDLFIYSSHRFNLHKMEINGEEIEENIRKHNLNRLVSNIDYFIYCDALQKDTRSFCLMLTSLIQEKSIFIKSISKKAIFEFQSIYFSIYLLYISFLLSFNVLLFSENYISEKFRNEGKISLNSIFKKMFYSSFFNMIISKIILYLSEYSKTFNKVIYEFHGTKDFKEIAVRTIHKVKIKLRLFLFFALIINISLLYFISSFCALYQKTQISLFLGFIFSYCFSNIIFFILCLIVSILRFASLYSKFERLYYISFYIRRFI